MSSSNGRTKRNIEDDRGRQRRQTGAQTDRQTMQALELIRRAFKGLGPESGRNGSHYRYAEPGGKNPWEGHMPADPDYGPMASKTAFISGDAVNHFGNVGSAWPYDPQSTSDYIHGPGEPRGRKIHYREGYGSYSEPMNFGASRGGYHSMRNSQGHSSYRHQGDHI